MTGEEKNVHERAVKLRKMTDDKLVEHIDHIREEAYNTGYSEAEAQRASTPAPGKTLPQLLEQLDAGECRASRARPPTKSQSSPESRATSNERPGKGPAPGLAGSTEPRAGREAGRTDRSLVRSFDRDGPSRHK